MNELAESSHSGNLKVALEQLNNSGKVSPRLSASKDGKVYEFSIIGMKLENALEILKSQIKPDVVNLTAMVRVQARPSVNGTQRTDLVPCLFVMTFDCFEGRLISLLEVCKEGSTIKTKDMDFGHSGPPELMFLANDDGDLEACFEPQLSR